MYEIWRGVHVLKAFSWIVCPDVDLFTFSFYRFQERKVTRKWFALDYYTTPSRWNFFLWEFPLNMNYPLFRHTSLLKVSTIVFRFYCTLRVPFPCVSCLMARVFYNVLWFFFLFLQVCCHMFRIFKFYIRYCFLLFVVTNQFRNLIGNCWRV